MFIEEKHLKIIKNILQKNAADIEIKAFGSRVSGKNLKKFSDLDLALNDKNNKKVSDEILMKLRNEFEESNLPFRVDIVDLNAIEENFVKIINQKFEIIK